MEEVLIEKKMKWAVLRYFSCSETMLTLLNCANGIEVKEIEEASDPLCAGICAELDAACGIFWGCSLAAGIKAQNSFTNTEAAIDATLLATTRIIEMYTSEELPLNCTDIIKMKEWGMIKYMLKGNLPVCQKNIAKWAPRFKKQIDTTLNEYNEQDAPQKQRNCACEAMQRISKAIGLEVEPYDVIVAGFAGGLGLSGNACGALASAIFTLCLQYFRNRNKPKHSMIRSMLQGFSIGDAWMNPSRNLLKEFKDRFGSKFCKGITKRSFSSNAELSDYLGEGHCDVVVNSLVDSAVRSTPHD